ncbi:hypothetical protein PUR34_41585 [Streptomyces sp. JV185]|uniref:helix-turn-helix transcriptional regulator n=1 Tax=unclassified Streptomyces TaxID=2593676 RepID=UPI002E771C37|nr:hypothetical protein [Streptomyces sp. JV185]MEE1774498.1 hypothetical protein [Streptomyces sp. JV185]
MPKKSDRLAALPAGLVPLLSKPQLETYYGVSGWQVDKWMGMGMPFRPFAGRQTRFDLADVEAWMAENDPACGDPKLLAASA